MSRYLVGAGICGSGCVFSNDDGPSVSTRDEPLVAARELVDKAGTQFDPAIVETFVQVLKSRP